LGQGRCGCKGVMVVHSCYTRLCQYLGTQSGGWYWNLAVLTSAFLGTTCSVVATLVSEDE
jgi:hypothetical protein